MISSYLKAKLLAKVLRREEFNVPAVYVSLHTGDPGEDGINEIDGIPRMAAAFSHVFQGETTNVTNLEWSDMPSTGITHIGLWDTVKGGHFLWGGPLAVLKQARKGDMFRIPAGELRIR